MIFKSGGLQLTLIDDFKEQNQNIPLVDIKVSDLGVETGNVLQLILFLHDIFLECNCCWRKLESRLLQYENCYVGTCD
jgi:hypothetical protein